MAEKKIPSPFPPPLPVGPEYSNPADAQPAKENTPKPQRTVVTTYSSDYFSNGDFSKDILRYQELANRKTGYDNLDQQQPFYPGFYCLGAISSLGKTTFAHQMADQIAMRDAHVLYFSLEQSHFELYSKSMARGFYATYLEDQKKNGGKSSYPTPSSIEIRRGEAAKYPNELDAQIDIYSSRTKNQLCIIDGAFSLTIEDIRSLTEQYIEQNNVTPVVFIDYLQIIAPTLINKRIPDTKTSIDHIVHALKVMQTDLNLSIVVISSLNRQSYLTPVDFESFKESGGIEYTADVMWGLQLSILHKESFYHHYDNDGKRKGETSLKEKREMIQTEKAKSIRRIDLVCLKNRYGTSNYTLSFEYSPANDHFKPDIIALPPVQPVQSVQHTSSTS